MKKIVIMFVLAISLVTMFSGNVYASNTERFTVKWLDQKYDGMWEFNNGVAMVRRNEEHGYIDKFGKEVIPLGSILEGEEFNDGLVRVYKNGKYGFADKTGKLVIPYKYYSVDYFSDGLARIHVDKDGYRKNGYINTVGKEVVPPIYDFVNPLKNGMGRIINEKVDPDGWLRPKLGYVDKTGKVIKEPIYDEVTEFNEGLALVKKDGKVSIIDMTGKIISTINKNYYGIGQFSEGLAGVSILVDKDKYITKYGFIDKTGKEIIPPKYDYIELENGYQSFNNGFSIVGNFEEGKGIIDKTGKVIVPLIYDVVRVFREGLAVVGKDGKSGFVNESGKLVIPLIYDYASNFKEGFAEVRKNGKGGIIDKSGKVIMPITYEIAKYNNEGVFLYSTHTKRVIFGGEEMEWSGGLYGIADKTGKVITPEIYGGAGTFNNGIAVVSLGRRGKFGIIDTKGNEVFPFIYDYIGNFSEGIAEVFHEGRSGLIIDNDVAQ